ncbi:PTS beta-glucoside transporter subunit IIBCA, partial [Streptococcus suis]
ILACTQAILNLTLGLGGLLIGCFHQVIVVSGVHHIFYFLEAQLVANTGAIPFKAIITAAMSAECASTVAVGVKTKNPKLK